MMQQIYSNFHAILIWVTHYDMYLYQYEYIPT